MASINRNITPFLSFDTEAEEAVRFYTSLFGNSRIVSMSHYPEAVPGRAGTVLVVTFELSGRLFYALNGGPHPFNEAISLMVECETQDEIDELWSKLSEGGGTGRCGWLTDRYGLAWQIAPTRMLKLLSDDDPETAAAAMSAMMQMDKIVIADIEDAVRKVRQ